MTGSDARIIGISPWKSAQRSHRASVVALLLLSPVIAEVLFGVTHVTTLFVLVPQIGTWGCGALIIRHLVRRRGRSWTALLLLGIAFAIAEECVIQQTSLAPLVGVDPDHVYARALGVNWVYLLWALGYESIWAVVLPVQLVELVFPAQRDSPWIGRRGFVIAVIVFTLASFVAWYSWTQVALPKVFHMPAYHPPSLAILIALAAIAILVILALGPRRSPRVDRKTTPSAARPWVVGLTSFALSLPWFFLVALAYGAAPTLPPHIPIALGLLLAGLALFFARHWPSRSSWRDTHRLAVIFGALAASMLAGFRVSGVILPIDYIGKLIFNVIAVLLLARLYGRLRSRQSP